MIIRDVKLETVCGPTSTLPVNTLPEIAFAGKSNVGKSSLLNALVNRRSLARTSAEPGKTQTINFYCLNHELYFVDLPGYGYAKASRASQEQWGRMIERYLKTSGCLRTVFLLIDIRHAPGANDVQMYRWIRENGYEPVIIATKLDKLKRSQISGQLKLIRQTLQTEPETILIPFSSKTRQGRDEVLDLAERLCGLKEPEEVPEENTPAETEPEGRPENTEDGD